MIGLGLGNAIRIEAAVDTSLLRLVREIVKCAAAT
jgi:hypothetical protein